MECDSFPGSISHKHKVFRCRHLKALVTGINGQIWGRGGQAPSPSSRGEEKAKLALISIPDAGWMGKDT